VCGFSIDANKTLGVDALGSFNRSPPGGKKKKEVYFHHLLQLRELGESIR